MATTTGLSSFKDIPAFNQQDLANAAAFVRKLEALREQVQLVIGTRGPGRGNPAWFNDNIRIGLINSDGTPAPPPVPPDDTTPPPVPTGFFVTPGINNVFVEWDAPTYTQGQGNALTTIYGTTWDGVGSPPTFSSSVPLATVPFGTQIYVLPTEPNVTWHIWITFTTYADIEGSPAGGTNGQSCTSGKLDGGETIEDLTITNALIDDLAVDNAKIASVSAGKIIAGSIAVGEYIQSSGFLSGSLGFRISGNGNAEFNNAIFRGDIYADGGLIGGAVIDSDGIESDNYVANTSGWRLDNNTGTLYANDIELPEGIVTSSAKDYSSYGTVDWPTSTSNWDPYPTSGSGMAGVLHTRHTGTLVIRSDASLNFQFSSANDVAAVRFRVGLIRKPSAGSGTFVPLRFWEFVVKTALKDASKLVASMTATFNFQFEPGELTVGTDYYFALCLYDVESLDSTGTAISVGSSSDLIEKDAFVGTIENKV